MNKHTPQSLVFFDDDFEPQTLQRLIDAVESNEVLVHVRKKDDTDFTYGIDPIAGETLKSTESYQYCIDEFGEAPELIFFSNGFSWIDHYNISGEKQILFVRNNKTIVQYVGDGKVKTVNGKVLSYEMCDIADHEDPLFRDVPCGVETSDYFTNKSQEVVAQIDAADFKKYRSLKENHIKSFLMFLEETQPLELKPNEIALMTSTEFLQFRNAQDKFHGSSSYDFDLEKLNKEYPSFVLSLEKARNSWHSSLTHTESGSYRVVRLDSNFLVKSNDDHETVCFIDTFNQTVYYNHYGKKILSLLLRAIKSETQKFEGLTVETLKQVPQKYLEPILKENQAQQLKKRFPQILSRKLIHGERFELRTTQTPYPHNSGKTIVLINGNHQVVAQASDEWGATLLVVAKEYRGKGLGQVLGRVWYDLNPKYQSGGFTHAGQQNALKIWKIRVNEFLQNGWYSVLVRRGKLSKEKLNAIIKDTKRINISMKKSVATQNRETKPLLYIDDNISFVIYDERFLDEPTEEYIYATGFFRSNSNGETFIYRLDYEPDYKNISYLVMVFMATQEQEKINVEIEPSDLLEIPDIKEIKVHGDYLVPAVDINRFKFFGDSMKTAIQKEKRMRKRKDRYQEIEHQLVDLAESKWN